ncbi:hypothetical protein PF002_g19926 [Phytophthora fragariae]|uniref:Uncharacterized protein n=1 Tax=Phytophthora fragariae TaxID=53985 RepID=A0A6A3Y091_9STRA|nr:hypothetical protein PF002_g19926 [Phytophthora fragariae]
MLHNIGIALFDEWDDAALDDEDDDDTDINSGPDGKTAKEKRERIKTVLLDSLKAFKIVRKTELMNIWIACILSSLLTI